MELLLDNRSPFAKAVPRADPRRFRPHTLQEAKDQINDYYRKCGWDEHSQLKWHEMCGLEPKKLEAYDLNETRKIIEKMKKGGMLIYRDWD